MNAPQFSIDLTDNDFALLDAAQVDCRPLTAVVEDRYIVVYDILPGYGATVNAVVDRQGDTFRGRLFPLCVQEFLQAEVDQLIPA